MKTLTILYLINITIFTLLLTSSIRLYKKSKNIKFFIAITWFLFLLMNVLVNKPKKYFVLFLSIVTVLYTILTHIYVLNGKEIKNKTDKNIIITIIVCMWLFLVFIFKKIATLSIFDKNKDDIMLSTIQQPQGINLNEIYKNLIIDRTRLLEKSTIEDIKNIILSNPNNQLAKDIVGLNINNIFYSIDSDTDTETTDYIKYIISELQPLTSSDVNIKKLLINLNSVYGLAPAG